MINLTGIVVLDVLFWSLVIFFIVLFIVTAIDAYRRKKILEVEKELFAALPWADPAKIISDAEYAPVLIRKSDSGKKQI